LSLWEFSEMIIVAASLHYHDWVSQMEGMTSARIIYIRRRTSFFRGKIHAEKLFAVFLSLLHLLRSDTELASVSSLLLLRC
jgi:hypothetical protein